MTRANRRCVYSWCYPLGKDAARRLSQWHGWLERAAKLATQPSTIMMEEVEVGDHGRRSKVYSRSQGLALLGRAMHSGEVLGVASGSAQT